MLKLELEELLEKELKALGVEFGRRVYGEEYYAGAEVDDNFGEDIENCAV